MFRWVKSGSESVTENMVDVICTYISCEHGQFDTL